MAEREEPAIFDTAEQAWRDALSAMYRMRFVMGVAVLIVAAPRIIMEFVNFPAIKDPSIELVFVLMALTYLSFVLVVVVQSALLAPAAIAAHRFVMLGEAASRYVISLSARHRIFFFFFLGVEALLAGPNITTGIWSFIVESFLYIGKVPDIPDWRAPAIIFCLFYLAALFILLRVLILFPAIAVDAPGAGWRNAFADGRGQIVRIFAIVGVTAIPFIGIQVALPDIHLSIIGHLSPSNRFVNAIETTIDVIFTLIGAVIRVLALCAFAAVASRLFAIFANKLNG